MYIAQQIAANAVNQVLAGRNLSLALTSSLALFPNATPQQRGAAQDLSYGTLRFYGEVDAYVYALLEKPLTDGRIHTLLLVAIYQLLHNKADHFTVVNQAVHAVSQLKKPAPKAWAKGLVNAILRNFLRQKETLAKKLNDNLQARYSYPQWWINKLKIQYPEHWEAMLLAGNQHPPMTLRVNARRENAAHYLILLQRQDIDATHIGAAAIILAKPLPVEKISGFNDGIVSVQDYGAQLAAHLLDVQAGMQVLDACAAPGGKTSHLLELADMSLTALDNDESRLARVQSNLNRLGLQATLLVGDVALEDASQHAIYDRILADVPCTASGIVRRHVDIKWLRREADIVSFATQQAKILPVLWQRLKKGGKLLYVTCSVFNEENQAQLDQFLAQHDDATQLPIALPSSHASATMQVLQNGNLSHLQLLPSTTHDGFFYALLQKN